MTRKTIFLNFINSPYFTKQNLSVLVDRFSIPETSLNTFIQRSLKDKTIISLKRNYYVTKEFTTKNISNLAYKYYLANILIKPSYLSRETALQHYGLLSESVSNYYTSITSRTTRKFTNLFGIYEYKSIKPNAFTGFKSVKFTIDNQEYSYTIAEPYKAIYDYIYYRTKRSNISKDELFSTLDELRINYQLLPKVQIDKLLQLF